MSGPTEDMVAFIDTETEEQHKIDSKSLLLFLLLLILTSFLIWAFKKRRIRGLHETGVSMLMGMVAGFIVDQLEKSDKDYHAISCNITEQIELQGTHLDTIEDEAVFNAETFFFVLLPPIIFYAGYDLKQKHFFRNIMSILVYAFVGTTMATFITGGMLYSYNNYIQNVGLGLIECLLFGAFISATDPVTVLAIYHDLHVDHNLYALVFGESVMNDAVALVLYSTIEQFKGSLELGPSSIFHALLVFLLIFLGSFTCGCFVAMATALIMKFTHIKRFPLIETSLFVLFSYATFLIGEASGLSGIVAVLFCGITQRHYTYHNLSEYSKENTMKFFGLLNFLCENFIFSYIGLSFFTYKCHQWEPGFIAFSILTILIARAAMIYPLSILLNCCRRNKASKIPLTFQHCMMGAGLRGAIAFALAMRNTSSPQRQMILSTTLVIVLVTVLIFGGGTLTLLQKMKIRVGVNDDEEEHGPGYAPIIAPDAKKSGLARLWQGFDKKYLIPVLSLQKISPGVDSWAAVRRTLGQFSRGEPENHDLPALLESDDKDLDFDSDDDKSDLESTASSELLDFEEEDDRDALTGDIGRASTLPNSSNPFVSALTPKDQKSLFKDFAPMGTDSSSV